jgi:ubiquinone/menaquinone biosynthesis C-methylase UbiE
MTNQWSNFWAQGHVTTFGNFFAEGYSGAIASWIGQVAEGYSAGARVVDIGCGNCAALTRLLALDKSLHYIGIDSAQVVINADAKEKLKRSTATAELLSSVPAEATGLKEHSIDAVISIYGIEYADPSQASLEIGRICAPTARINFLMHHTDSQISEMSARALGEFNGQEIDEVLGCLDLISERAEAVGLGALKFDARAESARQRINHYAVQYLNDREFATANITMFEFMTSVLKFFKLMRVSRSERTRFVDALRSEYESYFARFKQMLEASLDREEVDAFRAQLEAQGFVIETLKPLLDQEKIAAWELSGYRK